FLASRVASRAPLSKFFFAILACVFFFVFSLCLLLLSTSSCLRMRWSTSQFVGFLTRPEVLRVAGAGSPNSFFCWVFRPPRFLRHLLPRLLPHPLPRLLLPALLYLLRLAPPSLLHLPLSSSSSWGGFEISLSPFPYPR